jgi:diguanylate cyclase (GGDEF)-like protein
MALDLPTLFIITVFVSTVAGLMLLLSWLQNRKVQALALWGAAFIIGSVGVALVFARREIPDVWSIAIANAVVAAAYGIMWSGVRSFERHPISVPLMLAGAAVWLLACQIGAFYAAPIARTALMAAIVVTYSGLSAWELWRGRAEGLMSRWPLIVLLLVHAAVFLIRIPLAGSIPLVTTSHEIHIDWWTFVVFETVFFSISIAYLFGGLTRDRIVLWHQHASLIDPLTGVNNRRAFLQRGEKLLRRCRFERRPAALLLMDLDMFKTINDTRGHHAGDQVLIAFCGVAVAAIRPGDLFGRLGGEEFACLLPGSPLDGGREVAERIRRNFEAASLESGGETLSATVSIGVAISADQNQDLAALMAEADRALYRAKANGRNRVEHAGAPSVVRLENVTAAPA